MNSQSTRPSVQKMMFCLFNRPLHPELIETLAFRQVRRDDYALTVQITPSGHVLSWQTADLHLVEVMASADQLLPRHGNLLRHRFQGERTGSIPPVKGIHYQMSSQLEFLPPEIFIDIHQELLQDGLRRGLLYHHNPHHRLIMSPLGYVTADAWKSTLSINSFHTFPEECAILKTQSLIERIS